MTACDDCMYVVMYGGMVMSTWCDHMCNDNDNDGLRCDDGMTYDDSILYVLY